MKVINTVIFDMDGVLIDSEGFWRQAEKETLSALGVKWDEKTANELKGQTITGVIEFWYNRTPWEGSTIAQVEKAITNRVLELIAEKGVINPGVKDTLEYLQQNNYKIGLASNSSAHMINTVIELLGIKSYFQTIVSADFVKEGKPAPDVYLLAAKNLESNSENCLVIEDSFTGATAGKRANMIVIAVPEHDEFNSNKFDFVDYKLKSLEHFVATLNEIQQVKN